MRLAERDARASGFSPRRKIKPLSTSETPLPSGAFNHRAIDRMQMGRNQPAQQQAQAGKKQTHCHGRPAILSIIHAAKIGTIPSRIRRLKSGACSINQHGFQRILKYQPSKKIPLNKTGRRRQTKLTQTKFKRTQSVTLSVYQRTVKNYPVKRTPDDRPKNGAAAKEEPAGTFKQ